MSDRPLLTLDQIEVFCEAVPKTAEVCCANALSPTPFTSVDDPIQNFLALCASNYYDGCLFHRNIKGFMIQTGDPSNTSKGGQSVWGKPFADEIRSTLKVSWRRHPLMYIDRVPKTLF